MSAFSSPPPLDELKDFPFFKLTTTTALYRAHRASNQPWWFCSCMDCRFDLASPLGTCYLARTRLGAFVERFRGFKFIRRQVVNDTRVSRVSLPMDILLADCTASRALAFGITAELHASMLRHTTQDWARALHQAGFAGIRYFARTDPSQKRIAVAVFGNGGTTQWDVSYTRRVDRRLTDQALKHFGIRIVDD